MMDTPSFHGWVSIELRLTVLIKINNIINVQYKFLSVHFEECIGMSMDR